MSQRTQHWLALGRVEGIGIRTAHKLVEHFGTPEAVYSSTLSALEACGLGSPEARRLQAGAGLAEAEREIGAAAKSGCQVIAFGAAEYPTLLKQIADPPLALYVRGDAALLALPAVAMVGTRKPTAYGSSVAHRLATDLANHGLAIVSGLARGIDSASHRGALEVGGKTVAVLGCGVDVVYPRENKSLFAQIAERGALVSEFPLGTSPQPANFPVRNRVISGLSLGVVIVEAAEYSGSLITARLASEQDREVYAVPGPITSAQSFGPNLLIKQGAKLVDSWTDVFDELPAEIRRVLLPTVSARGDAQATLPLFESAPVAGLPVEQKSVLEVLRTDQAQFIDTIYGLVALPQPKVLAALLELEMSGLARQLPGMNFIRKL